MKKIITNTILFLSLILSVNVRAETLSATAVRDAAVMNARDDGRYDVFCSNGNRELVTDLDLRLNNVCPNLTKSDPTNILSMQLRSDGKFDIVCRNLRKLIVSEAEVIAGKVCGTAIPKVILEPGHYKVTSGHMSYYDHDITVTTQEETLKTVEVSISNGFKCLMNCSGLLCTGVSGASTCTGYKLEVLASTKYKFSGSPGVGIFDRQ